MEDSEVRKLFQDNERRDKIPPHQIQAQRFPAKVGNRSHTNDFSNSLSSERHLKPSSGFPDNPPAFKET